MNIPALKCARGYHKREREFKLLYFYLIFLNVMSIVVLLNKGNHFRHVVNSGQERKNNIFIFDLGLIYMFYA